MKTSNIVISTNIPVRQDGLPYSGGYKISDPGVSVYFVHKDEARCFACDRWESIAENMTAILKTIQALRGIERWGSSEMVDHAFRGFTALPAPDSIPKSVNPTRHWRVVFNLPPEGKFSPELIETLYRALAKEFHPDNGGSHNKMAELNTARTSALKELS